MADREPQWLLVSLHQRGFCVRAEGDRLLVWPASKLTPSDREDIQVFKGELLEAVRQNVAPQQGGLHD